MKKISCLVLFILLACIASSKIQTKAKQKEEDFPEALCILAMDACRVYPDLCRWDRRTNSCVPRFPRRRRNIN
jgi:hypothetical protein